MAVRREKFKIEDYVNTPELRLPFPMAEYKARFNKVRNRMIEADIDILYLTMPESMCYLTGYNNTWYRSNCASDWMRDQVTGVAVSLDHDDLYFFEMCDEEQLLLSSSVISKYEAYYDVEVEMYGREYKAVPYGNKENRRLADAIIEDLKREGWIKKGAVVGLELGGYRPTYNNFMYFKACFEKAGCSVVDGTEILHSVRKIKSKMEMQYMETASNIADIGHRAIRENLRAGMTETELCGIYTGAMYKAGGENAGIVNIVRSGPDRVWCFHAPASRRTIMPGDPVAVDLCGVYNRYHANQSRFYNVGTPDRELAEMYGHNVDIMEKVASIIKPNMYVRDFNEQIESFCRKKGYWGQGYWLGGYELGISFPPDWVGYYWYDPTEDAGDDIFEPGLCVNFEASFGVIETLMFGEKEARVLGESPWELVVV